MSLIGGWFPVAVVAAAVLAALACVPWEQRRRRRVLLVSLAVTAVLTAVVVAIVRASGALPAPVPRWWPLWLGGVLLAPVLGVVGWRYLRWRRLLPPLAFGLALVAAATLVNGSYQYFPTFRSLFGTPADQSNLRTVMAERDRRERLPHGAVVRVSIPGRVSHFIARDAYVWLPPAYLADPRASLPVLELLAGSPGTTLDWIRGGDADATADQYAREHGGAAPLIVMPDENGAPTADTECVDGPHGAAGTYLTVDVPAFMREVFQADTGPRSLAVAGLSEGGLCATMLALTHPHEYRAFGDYSGLAAPTVANVVAPGLTTRVLFGGSADAYARHDPGHLMRTQRFPDLAGWFEVGSADPSCARAQAELAPLARRAGIDTVATVVPGAGHDFTFWAQAFRQSLPFLAGALTTGHTP